MKAIVTGGSGYFGSLLIKKLSEKNIECAVLDIQDSDERSNDVEFINCDIRDRDKIIRTVKNADVVYHNVAQVPLAKDSKLFWEVNAGGTQNLLEACLKNKIPNVVYTSSSAVFGIPKSNPVKTTDIPEPGEEYGKAKLAGEQICRDFAEKGLSISVIRPRTILGHGRLGIFQILFEWIKKGLNVPVLGEGANLYQFVHAEDLADACYRASKVKGFEIYHCGTDRFNSMREVLEGLCKFAGTGSKVKSVPMKPAVILMNLTSKTGLSPLGGYHSLMYGRSMYFDISKAEKELNWKPVYSNDEMFRESFQWYLKNEKTLNNSSSGGFHRKPLKKGILSIIPYLI